MTRIASAPNLFFDELLYSFIGRLQEHLGILSKKLFSIICFGSDSVIATIEFPSHLGFFSRLFSQNPYFSVENLINNHTLLPYFSPFLPVDRENQLRRDMTGCNGPGTHLSAGIMASTIKLFPSLRFCPRCVFEDRKANGECYWHRVHQIPGVFICPIHKVFLQSSSYLLRRGIRQAYITAEQAIKELNDNSPEKAFSEPILVRIAEDSFWLLNNPLKSIGHLEIRSKYRFLLYQMGLCNYSGKIHSINSFLDRFENFFGTERLSSLDCALNSRQDNWLLQLIRNDNSTQHPLRHLLFLQFICQTPETLFALKVPQPFGEPPWPCLNPASDHYFSCKIDAIRMIKSKYTNGRPIGEFSCECGYVYRRTGPDNSSSDRFRSERISSYGPIWGNKLISLWNNKTLSLWEISRSLKADPKTIKSKAYRLRLPFPRDGPRISHYKYVRKPTTNTINHKTLHYYRNSWNKLISSSPTTRIIDLRRIDPAIFTWLYRNDRKWLSDNMPTRSQENRKSQDPRINWHKRDLNISNQINSIAKSIKSLPCKPVRITISIIGNATGQLAIIQKHIDKLPITAQAISMVTESREDFAIRRIEFVAEYFRTEGISPKRWQLIKGAGVYRLTKQPRVANAINQYLEDRNTDPSNKEVSR